MRSWRAVFISRCLMTSFWFCRADPTFVLSSTGGKVRPPESQQLLITWRPHRPFRKRLSSSSVWMGIHGGYHSHWHDYLVVFAIRWSKQRRNESWGLLVLGWGSRTREWVIGIAMHICGVIPTFTALEHTSSLCTSTQLWHTLPCSMPTEANLTELGWCLYCRTKHLTFYTMLVLRILCHSVVESHCVVDELTSMK